MKTKLDIWLSTLAPRLNEKNRKPAETLYHCMRIGAGSAQLLREKLRSHFGKRLDILGTAEYYSLDQMSYESIDFVISTIPIKKSSLYQY